MTEIVVMAGGRGQRLHPLTESTPKPLLTVGQQPILEQIVEMYARQGFKEFTFCLGYRGDQIEAYFGTGDRLGLRINYVHEKEPLGTAGALNLIEPPIAPFIVTNADVLTELDAKDLLAFHKTRMCLATVCTALYQHQVRYGVVESEGHKFVRMREKPIENFAVNAGIYVLSPKVLRMLPNGASDMPDLVERAKLKGAGVATYPLKRHWTDVGTFSDLAKAQGEWAPQSLAT